MKEVRAPLDPLSISDLPSDEKIFFQWSEDQPRFTRLVIRELLMKLQTLRSALAGGSK
jgi:hypothetical protein